MKALLVFAILAVVAMRLFAPVIGFGASLGVSFVCSAAIWALFGLAPRGSPPALPAPERDLPGPDP